VGALSPAAHGSTFGGSPLACAAAQAALGVLRDDRLSERAALLGAHALDVLRAGLRPTAFREVRGRGLLIGIELRGKVAPVLRALQERGVLALPAGPTVLRLLPPLVIAEDDWNEALQQVLETLNRAAE
jgi:acetylornithine/LysW-gamma-L-lysine aminotransferase